MPTREAMLAACARTILAHTKATEPDIQIATVDLMAFKRQHDSRCKCGITIELTAMMTIYEMAQLLLEQGEVATEPICQN